MILLEIICVVISLVVLIRMFSAIHKFHSLIPIVLVFNFSMVVPIFLELVLGEPKTSYEKFVLAMNDTKTCTLYYIFIVFAQLLFLIETETIIKKDKGSLSINSTIDIRKNVKVPLPIENFLIVISYITPFLTILAILLSPDPSYYFHLGSVYTVLNLDLQNYNLSIMNNLVYLLLLSIMILKWFDNTDSMAGRLCRIGYVFLIMIINHKRTFMMVAIGACLVIDIVKGTKKNKLFLRYFIYIIFAALYFVYYAYATDKVAYNNDWYYVFNEYFFREIHTKFAIYTALYPFNAHILDYPGQSIIFDLFYFIPRSIWSSKPWPYVQYFISGVMGYSSYYHIPWDMPTSYYPEFVSNFGIVGLFLSIIFTIWISRFLDRRGMLCQMLGTALICLLEVYYYDNSLKILAIFVFILYIIEKIKIRKQSTSLTDKEIL